MTRDAKQLRDRTKQFAIRIVKVFRSLPPRREAQILGMQLLRCGTSVGANYRAACRARSRAEFVSKIGIVVEEADESVFWLELLVDTGIFKADRIAEILQEANELLAIFAASQLTAKKHAERPIVTRQSAIVNS